MEYKNENSAVVTGFDRSIPNRLKETKKVEKVLLTIISALRGNPVRCVQDCKTALAAWEGLDNHYAGKYIINKLGGVDNMLKDKYGVATETENHVIQLKLQSFRLQNMGHV